MMVGDKFILCISTILLLVTVWIAFPVSDYRKQLLEISKEVANLKLQRDSLEIQVKNLQEKDVQHQLYTVSVTEDIEDLKHQLNEERGRRETFEAVVNNLKEKSVDLQSDMKKISSTVKVAFSARLSKSYDNIAPWETVVFSSVETNTGNAYNGANGEFTAPVAGNYIFFSHILSWHGRSIETSLQVNGESKMFLYSACVSDFLGSGSNMAVLHLNAGDKVKIVKYGTSGTPPFYIHHVWSTFSGFLLEVD